MVRISLPDHGGHDGDPPRKQLVMNKALQVISAREIAIVDIRDGARSRFDDDREVLSRVRALPRSVQRAERLILHSQIVGEGMWSTKRGINRRFCGAIGPDVPAEITNALYLF